MSAGPRAGRLSTAVFAVLVVASFAAFFIAQRLKHIPTAVQQLRVDPAFYPEGGGVPRLEAVSFQIERTDLITVQVVNMQGSVVASLAREEPLQADREVKLLWNGRRGAAARLGASPGAHPGAAPAPAGEYRIRILLVHRKFETYSPAGFILHRPAGSAR